MTTTSDTRTEERRAWSESTLRRIAEHIANGGTVYVSTDLRSTSITPKTWKRWDDGATLFRIGKTSGSLYMARGRNWDCVDFCRFTFAPAAGSAS